MLLYIFGGKVDLYTMGMLIKISRCLKQFPNDVRYVKALRSLIWKVIIPNFGIGHLHSQLTVMKPL